MKNFFVTAILLFLYCGSSEKAPAMPMAEVKPSQQFVKSVLMVIASSDFRDEEFKEPFDLLTKSGMKVTIASTDTAPAKGMLGMIVKPQILLSGVSPDNYDALIIIGGTGCKVLWDNKVLHTIAQRFNEAKKTIGAICIAPVVLARADILNNIKSTVYPDVKDEITIKGAQYTGSDVETSGNIITASGPGAAKEFAAALLDNLKK